MKTELAYHFVGKKLRNGKPIPKNGKWLTFKGEVKMCRSGLHASREPFDALQYAPGATLCLVEVEDIVLEENDKLVCRKRKILKRFDATKLLQLFARQQALSVIDKWKAPQVVIDYLKTGDPKLRSAAESAATSAAESAAWSAAWSAARSAAWSAATSAARSAARKSFNEMVEKELSNATQ